MRRVLAAWPVIVPVVAAAVFYAPGFGGFSVSGASGFGGQPVGNFGSAFGGQLSGFGAPGSGFNVGGFELGLDPDMTGITAGTGSVSAYWGVSDCEAAVKRLLELGASSHSPVQDVGDSIRVASVIDPFGNVLGVIENPNFAIDATN